MAQLTFDGKQDSLIQEIGAVAAVQIERKKQIEKWQRILPDRLKSADAVDLGHNYIFKGDNLPLLYSLNHVLNGKIKLIYIDPPYNTGKTFFGYTDSMPHDDWLRFMKNRLEIAKELLHKAGTIFISIDINEMAYLKVLCDEIFGRSNFVGEIIWETASDNNATQISNQHEYVLCFAKERSNLKKWKVKSEKANLVIKRYEEIKNECGSDDPAIIQKALRAWINGMKKSKEIDLSGVSHYSYVDKIGVFYPGNSANTRLGGYDMNLYHPVTGKACKKPLNGYRWPAKTFWAADQRGDVLWPADENGIPKIKKRIDTATELLKGYHYEDNQRSTKALTKILGEKRFHNPKSLNLLQKIIRFATGPEDTILDFFGGSGSTAHAVINVNNEDGTNRKFILIEKMNFAEEIMIPRFQQIMTNEVINFAKLQSEQEGVGQSYLPEKDILTDQFYDL
jgi:adenine-specific DNA-methyltransferase